MSVTLFCDTTLNYLTLGILTKTGKYEHFAAYTPKSSSILHSTLQDMLQSSGLRADDICRTVVTCGPGSFTGVRVGLALAHAFAFANQAEIFTLNTLRALAVSADVAADYSSLRVVVPAGQGDVYMQDFSADASRTPLAEAQHVPLEVFTQDNTKNVTLVATDSAEIAYNASKFVDYKVVNHPDPQRVIDWANKGESEEIVPLYVKPLSYKKVSA